MYSRILVPLDTSDLAERALVHAEAIARRFGADIELLTVIPTPRDDSLGESSEVDEFDPRTLDAQEYLQAIAARLTQDGIPVTTTVLRGDVAQEIIDHAAEGGCDVIVMCTHGRSGLGRWVYGSIADRTLRYSPVPVLLVRAASR